MPTQHASLNFYDELGVSPDAAPGEIRDAFRALVRILHPDHQTDEQLKETADRQMRKLNRIYAILSDPEKRRRYDEALEDEDSGTTIILSPTSDVNIRRLMERIAWVGAFAIVGAMLFYFSSDNPAAAPPAQPQEKAVKKTQAAPAGNPVSPDEVAQLQSDLRLMKMERDAAIHELGRLRAANKSSFAGTPEPVASLPIPTMTELPPPVPAAPLPKTTAFATARPVAQKPISGNKAFSGFWFYTKLGQKEKASKLYPPEFIEATITEQNGAIRGKFRSRYKIVDRAISPDVNFEFSGTPSGSVLNCKWNGAGGARGDLSLKMSGDNNLMVDWTANELGSIQGLVAGTATLTRRID